VRRPSLLLLDEPTSALDLNWQLRVLQSVRQETQQQGAIAFVASHDLNLALRYCDQVLIVGNGKALAYGPPSEALAIDKLRQAYRVNLRVERCSQGYPIVLADSVVEQPA